MLKDQNNYDNYSPYDLPIKHRKVNAVSEAIEEAVDAFECENSYTIVKYLDYPTLKSKLADAIINDEHLKKETEKKLGTSLRKLNLNEYRANYKKHFDFIRRYLSKEQLGMNKPKEEGKFIEGYGLLELTRLMTSAIVGLDCLEDAFEDPLVTDIYVIKWNEIYVERSGKNEKYKNTFYSEKEYVNFIHSLLLNDDKQVDSGEHKIVDCEIFSMRGNVIGQDVASKGLCLTLRKHAENTITLKKMITQGIMDEHVADFLRLMVIGECAECFVGITGSGKTTLLKAVMEDALSKDTLNKFNISSRYKRVLVCEDTPELFLETPNTVNMRTVKTMHKSTTISLDDLIISSLRMKPKYVICGEVRSVEAKTLVEAASTGHASICTLHANTIENALSRLVVRYSETVSQMKTELVREIVGGAIDYCIIIDDIPRDNMGRKITSIHEISFNKEKQFIETKPIVTYDFSTSSWKWHNTLGEKQQNLMLRRGVPYEELNKFKKFIESEINSNG